ncbi:hypothetical protein J4210_00805 [Candidatus Woesearchaeota archaeon]|nr:hypothetical protein [Candidatus Woesearchaeota archaeon]
MPRQLTLLGTIHTDPGGMKRLYRAIESLHPKTITFELERGLDGVHGFSAKRRDFLGKRIQEILNLEEERESEFKGFLREYGYESKIALGL